MNAPDICFDARMAHASGIGTYIQGLLAGILKKLPDPSAFSVITSKTDPWQGRCSTIPLSAKFYSLQEQWTIPWAFHKSGARVLHVPHYNIPAAIAARCVVTVHDLIHLKFPEFLPSRLALLYARSFFHHWIPRTRTILTVSENTKKDLIEMLGIPDSKITVTYLGVPEGFRKQTAADYEPVLKKQGLLPGYFLFVGNLKEFKNVQRLLQAYTLLKGRHPDAPEFVWVGKNFIPGFDLELKKQSSTRWFPNLERAALPSLYAGARALVFPSLYEGFGLPPLEAMACGTPVICSNRGSLPEVVGDAALLVDPLNVEELAAAMKRVWESSVLAGQLSEKGLRRAQLFSWDKAAEKTLLAYA